MTRRWILSALAALAAGPLAAVLLVGAPFATAGPTSASKAPLVLVAHASAFTAAARAAVAAEANAVLPKLTADGAGYERDGLPPQLQKGTTLLGLVSPSTPLDADLALVPRDPEALAKFATEVATPGTSAFRHYVSVSEFAQTYGATPAAIDAVRSAMTAAGLKVDPASRNGLEIKVTGTAAQFEQAFSTTLNRYRLANGRVGMANTLAPRIASSAAKYVSGVVGLSTLAQLEPLDDKPSKPAALGGVGRIKLPPVSPAQTTPSITPTVTVSTATTPTDTTTTPGEWAATASSYANGPQPCSAATAYDTSEDVSDIPSTPIVSLDSHLYTYDAFAKAYDFDPLYQQGDLGQGVNVGIYELESNYETDPPAFDACYGINSPVSYVEVDGGSGSVADGGTDAGFETSLDIETISALAPDAHITVYQGNQEADTGWLDTFDAIVSADHDQVVSVSYGVCEELEAEELGSAPQAEITLFEEAAAQGQTFSVSSGDAGAEGCREETDTEVPAVDDPAADPYVTGVGGTSLQSPGNPAAGTPPTEVVWNNGPVLDAADSGGAGGGGLSTVWQMPSYQIDAPGSLGVVNSESQGLEDDAGDICAGALLNTIEDEPTPPTYYCREVPDVSASADLDEGYTVYYDGAWNGVGGTSGAAPVWSALFADADSSAGCQNAPIGFANPSLYTIAGSSSYGHDFNDITSGNNDEGVSNGDYFEAMTGYDMASGLGTPIAANLVPALCSMATPLTTTQTVTEPGTTTTITTPGTTTTVTQPGTTTVETVTGTTTTVTTPPTTQTVTTPATTETVTEPPTTQTVTQPGTTQTQTVTTPGTTVTTPSSVVTVYEYSSGGCTRMLTFSVKPHGSLRAVKAVVYINGRIVHTFSGHALKKISFKHPAPRKFKLAIISTLSNGEKAGEALVFNGCKYSTTAWFVVKK